MKLCTKIGGVFAWAKTYIQAKQNGLVVKDKMAGELTNQEIMEKHGIKNVSQKKTWMK
ncbi:hypothetical protein [Bacillus sp. ISL-46]|uniref:hypothetical protein n=1 Tax=Bacillus sp. ISL-46 TaxID=2819129 RepID=UPI001BEB3C1E|nr:hypothetical protein [Bacillus sp. ISL-46]MBT2724996.1 hypothetical protein [Bacillus sp. ISL-46]